MTLREQIDLLISQLADLRWKRGLTQGEVARRMCISPPSVSFIENRRSPSPSIATVIAYANAIGARLTITTEDRTPG